MHPKKILVFRNDRFGEFLLIIPALRALKETFPGALVTLVCSPQVKELAERIPFADEVLAWGGEKHAFPRVWDFASMLRKKKFSMSLVFNPSKESHLICFLANIPLRAGYSRKWGLLLTRRIRDTKHLAEMHEVEYNLALAAAVGAHTKDKTLSIQVKNAIIENLIAIHPWTSDPVKQWPLERFQQLARVLAREPGYSVVIVGREEDGQKAGDYFFSRLDRRITNLTNKTSLLDLAGILAKSSVLISGDSGPVHLACSVGTPVVALFRNDLPGKTPVRWGPRSAGSIVIEKDSLARISVDEVAAKAREVLNRKR